MTKKSNLNLQKNGEKTLKKDLDSQVLLQISQQDSIAIITSAPKTPKSAIFWKRFLAKMVDFVICGIPIFIFLISQIVIFSQQFTIEKVQQINQICITQEDWLNLAVCGNFMADIELIFLRTTIFAFTTLAFYFILMPQSFGKKLLKIKLISQDNQQISVIQRFAREVLNLSIVVFIVMGMLGFQVWGIANFIFVTMFFANGRILFSDFGFHDQIAKTKVIEKDSETLK